MTFAPYWMQVFLPISRKLKNGVHLVEAEEWRKGWWKVKTPGSLRSTYVSPRVWAANPSIAYTGQPFGLAMQELHKLPTKEKKDVTQSVAEPIGPVCELGSAELGPSQKDLDRAALTRPDRVQRQRSVRGTRRTATRSKAKNL